jgi:hypothetical protein
MSKKPSKSANTTFAADSASTLNFQLLSRNDSASTCNLQSLSRRFDQRAIGGDLAKGDAAASPGVGTASPAKASAVAATPPEK